MFTEIKLETNLRKYLQYTYKYLLCNPQNFFWSYVKSRQTSVSCKIKNFVDKIVN